MSKWESTNRIGGGKFICGFCNALSAPNLGYRSHDNEAILICPNCDQPTYIKRGGIQVPSIRLGNDVLYVPDGIESLYNEARDCTSVSAFTASVLACRKLLMNIAVEQGAEENKKFIEYVDFLSERGFIPPNGRHWVDHIRKRGNEATHEISLMTKQDAEELIKFIEKLLKFIYEFPNAIPTSS